VTQHEAAWFKKKEFLWYGTVKNRLTSNSWTEKSLERFRNLINHPEVPVFIITLIILLSLNLSKGDFIFHHDSNQYWQLRHEFDQNNTVPFSFSNYKESVRSYLLPWINYVISKIGDSIDLEDVILLEIVQAFAYSLLISILIPHMIDILFHHKTNVWQISLFSFLVIFFWQGHFFYPLSDFLGVFLFVLGTYLFIRFHFHWFGAILAGLAWGGAALVRPSYLVTIIPLLLWAFYYYVKEIHPISYRTLIRWIALPIGVAIVFAPQININIVNFGVFSPFPQARLVFGVDLFTQQLSWGTSIQKYETNIGSSYPSASVIFLDSQGQSILLDAMNKQIIPDYSLSLKQYIKLVLRYPLDFMSIYMRRFFNGLDIIYNTVYVEDIYSGSIALRLINYSLWFLVFLYISQKAKMQRNLASQFFLPLIFALPALLSIPSAMEVRFMLPLHLMAYVLVSFWILPEFVAMSVDQKRDRIRKYIIWYFIFTIICFILSSNTYMSLEHGNYLLSGK
jgi:hypothetical protein